MASSPCCPPSALPAATSAAAGATAPPRGREVSLPSAAAGQPMRCYLALPSDELGGRSESAAEAGVVMFHDIFGYGGGRTHHIADELARRGFAVVSPDWFGEEAGGVASEGDLWPPWRLFTGAGGVMVRRARFPWKVVERKLLDVVLPFLRQHVRPGGKLGVMGFCWGGWAMMRACGLPGDLFACGVSPHASLQGQKIQAEGPTLGQALRAVSCPVFLAPAWGDPSAQFPDGSIMKILNKNPKCRGSYSVYYKGQLHGFSNRGDIRDPKVKRDVDDVLRRAGEFFEKHLLGAQQQAKL